MDEKEKPFTFPTEAREQIRWALGVLWKAAHDGRLKPDECIAAGMLSGAAMKALDEADQLRARDG